MSFWVSAAIHLDECFAFNTGTRGNSGATAVGTSRDASLRTPT